MVKQKSPKEADVQSIPAETAQSRRSFLQLSMIGGFTGALAACGSEELGLPGPGTSYVPDNEALPEEAGDTTEDSGDLGIETEPEDQAEATPDDEEPEPEALDLPQPDALPEAASFGIGVSSGDARHDRVVLNTRYDSTEPLVVLLWRQDATALTPISMTDIEVGDGGYVRVEVNLPTPDVYYLYAFCQKLGPHLVSRSPLGRFLAPPSLDTLRPIRIGASSCAYNALPPMVLGNAAERDDLELFCLLGDTSYNDGCETIQEFRDSWESNLSKHQFKSLRASTSVIGTWDDHEITNDWTPESIDPELMATAKQAFTESIPMIRSEQGDTLWRKIRWGRTLEIFALDSRSERQPSRRNEPDGEYLSRAQLDWLKQGLAESEAVFKLILNSVPIGAYPPIFDVAVGDRWEGYPAQREEILRWIEDSPIGGVIWLAGDFHMAATGRVSPEGPGSQTVEILAGPAAQVGNVLAWTLPVREQFDWATSRNNYATLDFDPIRGEVQVIHYGVNALGNEEILNEVRYEIA